MYSRQEAHIFPQYTREEYETAGEALKKIALSEIETRAISKANEKRERVKERNLRRKKGNL